jgi:hypothetical protein
MAAEYNAWRRAYVRAGDKKRAKAAYEDVLGLWKTTDPHLEPFTGC